MENKKATKLPPQEKNLASTSQENFFKKSNKNFNPLSKSEYYGTLIQIMRSDIVEFQSIIKKHSDVLMFYQMKSKKYYFVIM